MSSTKEKTGLTSQAYAEHRRANDLPGGSRWAVTKALRDGRITRNEDGRLNPVASDAAWERNTDPTKQTTKNEGAEQAVESARSRMPSINQSRAVTEAYKAKMARLQYEEKAGKLISAKEVQADGFKAGRMVRDGLLAIPIRVSAMIAAETDPNKIQAVLEEEFRAVLTEMSNMIEADVGKESPPGE